MSRIAIGKAIISAQVHEKSGLSHVQPEQLVSKKMPRSQELPHADQYRSFDPLEDVTFLRLPDVKAVTGLGKTSIYELIRNNRFPAPVRLGPRAVAWVRSEVRQWALERVQASRSAA
jgi:prophage regulatory protein